MGRDILFICSLGRFRSKTAAMLWHRRYPDDTVHHTGMYAAASEELAQWVAEADKVYVMEQNHKDALKETPGIGEDQLAKVWVLDIPDEYVYMETRLINLLKERLQLPA